MEGSPRLSHGSPELSKGSPKFSDGSSPRFIEHFNTSPPPHHFQTFYDDETSAPRYTAELPANGVSDDMSNKKRDTSQAEYSSPFPEAVQQDYQEKEVAPIASQHDSYRSASDRRSRSKKHLGMSKGWLTLLVVLFILTVIGLSVGLSVGLSMKNSSKKSSSTQDDEYMIGGAINPQYYSTAGAFNGSGIALASQSFSEDIQTGTQGTLVMYFQHWSGQIRWQQLSDGGQWLGGDITTIVAADAKNSTPISAVAYALNGTSTWHIFYVNTDNLIRQKSNSNTSNVWIDGPINQLNLQALDSDEVGVQACYSGFDYGAGGDYHHTPLPNQSGNASLSNEVGMHIWYASDNTTFQQYGWRDGDDTWTWQHTWANKNGHAGVGCYSWGPGSVTYVMFVNLENSVEFWWQDQNTNQTNTTSHPLGVWVNSSIAINDVYPSSSLGYTNYFYAQMDNDLSVNGYNISWAAENTTIQQPFTVQGELGLAGTHMSVTALPNTSGGNDILVFYQTNGTDISEYTRDLVAGQWSSVSIPIPQS